MPARWILLFFAFVGGVIAGEPAVPEPPAAAAPDPLDIILVLHDLPTPGFLVLPATETVFRFKLKETGTVVEFRWSDLDPAERARVKKLARLEEREIPQTSAVPTAAER